MPEPYITDWNESNCVVSVGLIIFLLASVLDCQLPQTPIHHQRFHSHILITLAFFTSPDDVFSISLDASRLDLPKIRENKLVFM